MREAFESDRESNAVGQPELDEEELPGIEPQIEQDRRAAWPSPLLRAPDGQKRKALTCDFEELK